MPVADIVRAAKRLPKFKKPDGTDVGPAIQTLSDEATFHPVAMTVAFQTQAPPPQNTVNVQLAALTTAQRQAVLDFRLAWLNTKITAANAALTAAGYPTTLPGLIVPTSVQAGQWPFQNIAVSRVHLESRLNLKQQARSELYNATGSNVTDPENTDTADASALLAGGSTATVAGDGNAAAAMLLQMRCVADIYGRWETAANLASMLVAAQTTNPPLTKTQMLARVLAFWRIEGDFSLPPETDTLDGSDTPAGTSPIGLPTGRCRLDYVLKPKPHMYCVTCLAIAKNFSAFQWDLSSAANQRTFADECFTLILAGLDILWDSSKQISAENVGAAGSNFATDPNAWAALNWPSEADAKNNAAARQALLDVASFQFNGETAVRYAPESAAKYLAAGPAQYSGANVEYAFRVLSEALRYMNRLSIVAQRFTAQATATSVPEALVYLLYHTGNQGMAMLASAVAAAVTKPSASSAAQALVNALPAPYRDSTSSVRAALQQIRIQTSTDESVKTATANWPQFGPDFGSPAVLAALNTYICTEGLNLWHGWVGTSGVPAARQNIVAYNNCYNYFLGVINGA